MPTTGDLHSATAALLTDSAGNVLLGSSLDADVPADASVGYARGCLWFATDATTLDTIMYMNIGTPASADFDLTYQSDQS